MEMHVIDLHCDALFKLWESNGTLSFYDSPELDTNLTRLKKGKVKAQAFAIFVDPSVPQHQQFHAALAQVDYFYEEVIRKHPEMKMIKEWSDFIELKEGEIGAFLTLEGVHVIGNEMMKLRILHNLGIRSVGLTWNSANLAADGVEEPRGGGLTAFGKEVVQFNNEQKLFTDVSHLSEQSFWDVMEIAKFPIATHSNTKKYCDHPRNLTDEQITAMFEKGGMIHVVYYADFVKTGEPATISDLIRHIDHLCSLGGVKKIGLGSDFDGFSTKIKGLEDASKTQNLINELLKYYREEEVRGFAYENFLNHLPK